MSKRQGITLCYPFDEKRLAKWKPPYIVQPKLDGERCRAVFFENSGETRYALLSSEGNEINSVPHINKALELTRFVGNLDGELYAHGMPFEEIHSIVSRKVNLHPQHRCMHYHIFDIISTQPQFLRADTLDRYSKQFHLPLHLVPTYIAYDLDEVMRAYDEFIQYGYEGMIVRNWEAPYIPKRTTYIMKFKPKKSDYYQITWLLEEMSLDGKPKNRLGAFICKDSSGNNFSVGSGLTDEQRVSIWRDREKYIGKMLHVGYQHLTSKNKVPRFPVFLNIEEFDSKYIGLK